MMEFPSEEFSHRKKKVNSDPHADFHILEIRDNWKYGLDIRPLSQQGKEIRISSGDDDLEDLWELSLSINQICSVFVGIDIELKLIRCLGKISAKYILEISNRQGAKLTKSRAQLCEYNHGDKLISWHINSPDFLNYQGLWTPEGTYTIFCKITIAKPIYLHEKITPKITEFYQKEMIKIPESTLFEDMKSLLKNEKRGDFVFKFGDKQLRVTKDILSSRSSVFAAMFKQKEMEKNQKNYVDILDIKYEVFQHMLLYIYTDQVPKIEEMAEGLLAVADKYQLDRLKAMCEDNIYKKISMTSVLKIFILSDMYRSEQLKKQALKYIKTHKMGIIESDEFKSLMNSDGKQGLQIILEAINLD